MKIIVIPRSALWGCQRPCLCNLHFPHAQNYVIIFLMSAPSVVREAVVEASLAVPFQQPLCANFTLGLYTAPQCLLCYLFFQS
jgi:hypothetical protein